MRYQINKFGKLETWTVTIEEVEERLFENVSLMHELNKMFFASQDREALKIIVLAIMESKGI